MKSTSNKPCCQNEAENIFQGKEKQEKATIENILLRKYYGKYIKLKLSG